LLVEFVDDIPRICIFEENFLRADLAIQDANSSNSQPAKSLQRPSKAFDIAPVFGKATEG
jgi:hypothetical protein